jgi:hypothetical protein
MLVEITIIACVLLLITLLTESEPTKCDTCCQHLTECDCLPGD